MDAVGTRGKTVDGMKASINLTRSMDSVHTDGQMDVNIRGSGSKENSMGEASTYSKIDKCE